MEECVWKLSLNGRKSGGISAFAANAGFHDYKSVHSVPLHFSSAAVLRPINEPQFWPERPDFIVGGIRIMRNMYNLKCPLI